MGERAEEQKGLDEFDFGEFMETLVLVWGVRLAVEDGFYDPKKIGQAFLDEDRPQLASVRERKGLLVNRSAEGEGNTFPLFERDNNVDSLAGLL